jgi:eukaryotic-like serine/threonine-protein kinase
VQRAQQLGRYHLLDRVAFGGMAEIYRAKTFDADGHAHLVAVKRVLAHLAEDPDFIQMLVDEARIASVVVHPNVARVYEFARVGDDYFIAMEYVDGKDVRTILERCRQTGRTFPAQHAAWIASQAALALHATHTVAHVRIVHRDVSPSNLICAYTGEVKLCDFGIAKATLSSVHTRAGVIKGKVKYMSPEQALGRKLDHRSDLFSLGSVLYEMLTRRPPFMAPNEMDLLIRVRDAKYTPIHELEPGVPPRLEAIVDRALSRSRSERFQSGEEMAAALDEFLREHAPSYARSHLGRYVRRTFEQEIERELRLLEEYVLGEADPENVAVNLIADSLGPDAPYSRFRPAAPGGGSGLEGAVGTTSDDTTAPGPRRTGRSAAAPAAPATPPPATPPPATPPPATPPPATPPPATPPDVHRAETEILDRRGRRGHAGSPGGLDPRELDPAIHDSPTQIIRRGGRDK